MGKSIRIVTLSVDDFSDGRKVANHIEGSTYKDKTTALEDILRREGLQTAGVGIMEPTSFMEACNEQDINLEGVWISYIYIEE